MKKRLLCFLIKNNQFYNIGDDNIFKQDKNCYIITKYGSMAQPVIFYDKKYNGTSIVEQELIGGYKELIEFLSDKSNSKVYLRGFNRATIGRILRLLLEKRTSKIVTQDKEVSKIVKNEAEQPIINLGLTGLSQECMVVANYIIEEVNKYNEGKPLRNQIIMHGIRLQKLLYFSDVEHMKVYHGIPMFRDNFYAWPSGPVIPEIYYRYIPSQNGNMHPIYDGLTITITDNMKSIIDKVIEENKELDTLDMKEKSNIAGGPWA